MTLRQKFLSLFRHQCRCLDADSRFIQIQTPDDRPLDRRDCLHRGLHQRLAVAEQAGRKNPLEKSLSYDGSGQESARNAHLIRLERWRNPANLALPEVVAAYDRLPRRHAQPTAILFGHCDQDERRVMYVNSILSPHPLGDAHDGDTKMIFHQFEC